MSTTTDRLQLIKPDDLEFADIDVLNGNFDKINTNFVPSAKLRSTVSVAIAMNAVNQAVNFNEVDHDSYAARTEGPMASSATDRITCRKSGIYLLNFLVEISYNGATTGGYRAATIFENGNILARANNQGVTANSIYTLLNVTDIVDAIAGDYWSAAVTNTSGGVSNHDNSWTDSCVLSATWLGTK